MRNVVYRTPTTRSLSSNDRTIIVCKFAAQNSHWRREHLARISTGLLRTIPSSRAYETADHTWTPTSSTRRQKHFQTSSQRDPGQTAMGDFMCYISPTFPSTMVGVVPGSPNIRQTRHLGPAPGHSLHGYPIKTISPSLPICTILQMVWSLRRLSQ